MGPLLFMKHIFFRSKRGLGRSLKSCSPQVGKRQRSAGGPVHAEGEGDAQRDHRPAGQRGGECARAGEGGRRSGRRVTAGVSQVLQEHTLLLREQLIACAVGRERALQAEHELRAQLLEQGALLRRQDAELLTVRTQLKNYE